VVVPIELLGVGRRGDGDVVVGMRCQSSRESSDDIADRVSNGSSVWVRRLADAELSQKRLHLATRENRDLKLIHSCKKLQYIP
jgi:hypothetical protein